MKPFKCGICETSFARKGYLSKHIKTHSKAKQFKCTVCEKSFVRKCKLSYHMGVHSEEKPFECEICKERFKRKDNLQSHMINHSGEKPFKCHICEKCFFRKSNLSRHINTHLGDKPFKCDFCDKCFAEKGSLTIHVRNHTGERPFTCGICGLSFIRRGYLSKHIKNHLRMKPFKCEYCKKGYMSQRSFERHVRSNCNKNNLIQDIKIHSSEKPFICCDCGKHYTRKSNLIIHLRTQHMKEHTAHKDEFDGDVKRHASNRKMKSQQDKHIKKYSGVDCSLCTESTEECVCSKNLVADSSKNPSVINKFMLECQTCLEKVFCKSELELHLQIHGDYKCIICNNDYRNCNCSDAGSSTSCVRLTDVTDVSVKDEEFFPVLTESDVKHENKLNNSNEMITPNNEDKCKISKFSTNPDGPVKEEFTQPVVKIKEEIFAPFDESVHKFEDESTKLIAFKEELQEEYVKFVENISDVDEDSREIIVKEESIEL